MSYALTVKSQVTVPKVIRQHLHVEPGQLVDYEPLPDGSVRMFAVREPVTKNPFAKFIGTGVSGMTTEEILNETRGKGWNK
ncbi:MAG: hypothetical protein Q8O29_04975 [Polaromonas sp.]|uniref:AbrB/MazE/SpoVT family DNA-binding domain-containing protein n=1 Tax=Polaromonas sp. TaxID=1869339 RepID=UPI00273562BF|nr:hypothetical protein [Polaromonas sp.]MDP2817623.1 hypothetical protein [Polaromonas sp.]